VIESVLDPAIDILSATLLVGGAVFYVIGMIGLNRMPDVFTRMHAASVSETLGLGLLFLGMAFQAGFSLVLVKLVVIFALIMLTAPIATHALARAALHDGNKPLMAGPDGTLEPTDPETLFPELAERLDAPLSSESVSMNGGETEGAPSNS